MRDEDSQAEIQKLREHKEIIKGLWREVSELVAPWLIDMDGTWEEKFTHSPGHYSGAAKMNLEVMSRGAFSHMVGGDNMDWFEIGTGDEQVERDKASQEYFERLRVVVSDGLTADGYYDTVKPAVENAAALGTDVVTIVGDYDAQRVDFIHWHPGDILVGEDLGGRVDRLAVKVRTTPHDLAEIEGIELPFNLKAMLKFPKESRRNVELWGYFRRMRSYEEALDNNMTWKYQLIDGAGEVLSESPMRGLPGHVWRYERAARTAYGSGPGIRLFRDLLQSNKIQKLLMKEAEVRVNPPLWLPTSDRDLYLDPGSKNYVATTNPGEFPRRMIDPADMLPAMQLKQEIDQLARVHFFTDFFLQLTSSTNRKTQLEVQGMMMETSAQITSFIDSMERNQLTRDVRRYTNILWEQGRLPDPPNQVRRFLGEGGMYGLKFIGPLSKMRRYMFTVGQDMRMIENVLAPMGQIPPDHPVLDYLDMAEFLNRSRQYMSGGRSIVRTEAEAQEIRAERQMQQMQMQQAAMQQQAISQTQAAEPGSPAEAVMNG